ncbi:MAG: hypothetical protein HP490_07500 [Nitrospira sp.]|nr:hypothetical protein [Nitrospira sp.]MBH0186670.1 hypothetical protein [Nitrospira sp.]MBH0188449.1 hypothetical protein [Nitrospira sp.]
MTPAQAATALLQAMPLPPSLAQLEEYGLAASPSTAQAITREILSLNLYWIIAAIEAHIPMKYRDAIRDTLLESIKTTWWVSGQLGPGTWDSYHTELNERRARYSRLVDHEGLSHMAVSAEAASQIEHQDIIPFEDRDKLLVLMIDYAPAAEYGRLLEEVG